MRFGCLWDVERPGSAVGERAPGRRRPRSAHGRLRADVRDRGSHRAAPTGFGGHVVPDRARGDRAVRLARGLHRLQPLRQRQPADHRLQLRRGARPVPRDARRVALLPAPVTGPGVLPRLVGVHGRRGGALHGRRAGARARRARLDPQLDPSSADDAAADADRRELRRGEARPPEDRGASRVRARRDRIPRRGRTGAAARAGARVADRHRAHRRRVRRRPCPDRVLRRKPRGDPRPPPDGPALGRARLDRPPVLRDLHVARHARRRRGDAGRDPPADAARSQLTAAEAVGRSHVGVGRARRRGTLPRRNRARHPPRQHAAAPSIGSRVAAAAARPSRSSSSGPCSSAPRRDGRRSWR